jgi:hypothetical protein
LAHLLSVVSCYFIYSDTAGNFYTPTIYEESLPLYPALARMAHDGPCLRMSGIGNTDTCFHPRHVPKSGKLGTTGRLPQLLQLQQNYFGKFSLAQRRHRPRQHQPHRLHLRDYIHQGTINHHCSALTSGYIDIGNKGYHLTSDLCSSQTVHVTTDTTVGREGVLEYITLSYFWQFNIVI